VRSHFYKPLVDENGDLLRYALIEVFAEDGVTPYDGVLYRDEVSETDWPNPFVAAPGLVEFYIEGGARLVLGVTVDENTRPYLTEAIDVMVDPAEMVFADTPLFIYGLMPHRGVLGADGDGVPSWITLKIDHEHAQRAADSTYLGREGSQYQQVGSFPATTAVGVLGGGWGPYGSLLAATMLGTSAIGFGSATVALGFEAYAAEHARWPYEGGALALGHRAVAQNDGVALGEAAEALADTPVLALGREALAGEPDSVALGVFAHAGPAGVALGWSAGSSAWGTTGSVGIGADAQYGLPSPGVTEDMWAVMIGAHDPSANRLFPWANPKGSQSESWMIEYTGTMLFAARTVQFQRHLNVVLAGSVRAETDATLGQEDSLLGFYGATPQPRREVGDDEPGSAITALDNLIYALRDLGLLKYRTEALASYQATDLEPLLRQADCVDAWPEHHGRDVARTPAGMQAPNFDVQHDYDSHPSVAFWNSDFRTTPKPRQALITDNLIPLAKHVIAVAEHNRNGALGHWEALLNFYQNPRPNDVDDVAFVSQAGPRVNTWSAVQSQFQFSGSVYAEDNKDQTRNMQVTLDHCFHAWRATNPSTWPYARMVIGGGHDLQLDHDFWQGYFHEVTAMDKTWSETAVRSMTAGLMFRYRIKQDDSRLLNPAQDFIVRQHKPIAGVTIGFDQPYPDDYTGRIRGWVRDLHKPLIYAPYVDIFSWFDCYDYCGPMAGYWANLPDVEGPNLFGIIGVPEHYAVRVTSTTCDTSRGIYIEWLLGLYFLGNVGLWSTFPSWIRRGDKRAYLIDKRTNHVLARSDECQRVYYDDVEVRVYTRAGDVLTWRETSFLWGDGTWSVETYYPGTKVARLIELSTGNVLATTEWDEIALPRYTLIDNRESDYSIAAEDIARTYDTALAVMALVESGPSFYPRARRILATLRRIANGDGSLNDAYVASNPVPGVGNISIRAVIWVGLAALHYQRTTGDQQYQSFIDRLALWLFGHQADGSFYSTPTDTTQATDTSAAGYFFFRGYAETV
jgi:hypothetical protein